jgi:phytoene dehydrogenase-like protein
VFIERFAPGLRERIAAVRTHTPQDLWCDNPNNVGGDINGGSTDPAGGGRLWVLTLDCIRGSG